MKFSFLIAPNFFARRNSQLYRKHSVDTVTLQQLVLVDSALRYAESWSIGYINIKMESDAC